MRGPIRALALVASLALLAGTAPASAQDRPGPCALDQGDGETIRQHSKRLIRCAVDRWPVHGGATKAICIADAESGLNPDTRSAGGTYLGLFQHSAELWPDRYDTWTRRTWALDESALSGRTGTIVTIRMVNANGWGTWAGVGDC